MVLSNCLVASERHQCHMTGEFDGICHHALVFSTELVASRTADLELGGHELTQELRVLIINVVKIFLTDIALHS